MRKQPILAIDFGTTTSSAIVVADGVEELIDEPLGQTRVWPSAVYAEDGRPLLVGASAENRKCRDATHYRAEFKPELGREPVVLGGRPYEITALVTAVLDRIRSAAQDVVGTGITRAVLTVPASYGPHDRRSALMLSAGADAGFRVVELLPEPVAAALAPLAGDPLRPGSLILVYDFGGGTFDTALVRIGAYDNTVLGYAAIDGGCGGRDIDTELYRTVVATAGRPLADLVDSPRRRLVLTTLLRQFKHQLSDTESVDDYVGDTEFALALTRDQLAKLTAPFVDRTLDRVHDLLSTHQLGIDEVDEVLLVGGVTRMPIVRDMVRDKLGRPVRHARVPELAVVQGAARFAAAADQRVARPWPPESVEQPVRWRIPGGSATMLAWQVAAGSPVRPGQPLGRVRLTDGVVWELVADATSRIAALHADPGDAVHSGDWLVTVDTSPMIATNPTPIRTFRQSHHVNCVAFSPDGTLLAAGGDDSEVTLWSVADDRVSACLAHPDRVLRLAFDADGTQLATACAGNEARLWPIGGAADAAAKQFSTGAPVNGLSLRPGGGLLAVAAGALVLWPTTSVFISQIDRQTLNRHLRTVPTDARTQDVCFGPNGSWLVTGHADGSARVWDVVTWTARLRIDAHTAVVHRITVSPDGDRLATACVDGRITVWDTASGDEIAACTHGSADVNDLAFSLDGELVASAGDDHAARVWSTETGKQLAVLTHNHTVQGVAFHPNGTWLATASWDHTVRIWDLAAESNTTQDKGDS